MQKSVKTKENEKFEIVGIDAVSHHQDAAAPELQGAENGPRNILGVVANLENSANNV